MKIMLKLLKGGIKMSRKLILFVFVAVLSMFAVQNATIQSVNARYVDKVTDPNSKIPHTYVYYDEGRNFLLIHTIAGNKSGTVVDLSSAFEKEPGLYVALSSVYYYSSEVIEPDGYFYIRTLDEKNKKYQYGFSKTAYGPNRWYDLRDGKDVEIQLIIKRAKEKGNSGGSSKNTKPVQDPMSIDLMKCWQEDVDASSGADQKILSTYMGMPEEEFYSNFSNWSRVVDYVSGSVGDYGTECHMERGNKYLKEKLSYYAVSNVGIMPKAITFETNQRAVARQIFERFKKNLSALYEENSWNNEGTRLLYSTHDHSLVGHLTINADYKKDAYSVIWTGMNLAD